MLITCSACDYLELSNDEGTFFKIIRDHAKDCALQEKLVDVEVQK